MIPIFVFLLFTSLPIEREIRVIEYNGQPVNTTYTVNNKFYGEYKGKKSGYLILKEDGTGSYNYDVFVFNPSTCKKQPIELEWGFLVNKDSTVVANPREYGWSFPILFKSTSATSFQGCRETVMLDFIMEYKNGTLGVSSSDDWTKKYKLVRFFSK